MPVTSSEYPPVQNTKLQPVPWNPVTPNNLKAGFLAFPVWFKILTVVFDHWMICWCRFIFHCYKHYSSWSLTTELPLLTFTAELFLLVFHHWITPLGLSLLNYHYCSFTAELPQWIVAPELPLLVVHHWMVWFFSGVCSKGKKRFGTPSLQRMVLRLEWQIPHKLPFWSLDNLCKEGQTYGLYEYGLSSFHI